MYGDRQLPVGKLLEIVPVLFVAISCSLCSQDWQRVGVDYHAADIIDGGRIIVVGDFGGIMLSEDNGTTWTLPTSDTWAHLRAVRFRNARSGFAAGDGGTLLQTTDGGKTWTNHNSPVRNSIRALDFPTESVGYGLADSGVLIRTGNGGEEWDTLANRFPGNGTGMSFFDDVRGVVVSAHGAIYRTENGGEEWEPVYSDSSVTFSGVAFDAAGATGYACTLERKVLKSTDAGVSWQRVEELQPGVIPRCIAVSEAGGVYIGGQRILSENPDPFNAVAWSDDSGETWQRPSLLITGFDDLALEGIAHYANRLVFAGNNGTVLTSELSMEKGVQRPISNSLLTGNPGEYELPVYRVAFSGDTGIATVNYALGASKTIFLTTTDGGTTWLYGSTQWLQNYLDIFGFPEGEFLVFSSVRGGVDRTTNAGRTWISQDTTPTIPKSKSFRAGTFLDKEHGYKTGDSLIYQTTNGGKSWQPRFFSGIEGEWSAWSVVTNIAFPTLDTGYAVYNTGEGNRVIIVKTTDAGETWREVGSGNDGSSVYGIDFADGDRGSFCEGRPWEHSGVLYSTTNGGESWDSVAFEDAAPTAVKYFDERNGFVLGSPFLLLRTTDGGESWNREYPWPSDVDTSGLAFNDIALLPDERTVVLIGNGVIARKTYPEKLAGVPTERTRENPAGILTAIPNPATDRVRFEWRSFGDAEAVGVRLYDAAGRDVLRRAVPFEASGVVELDVSELPAGTYRAIVEGVELDVLAVRSVVIVR